MAIELNGEFTGQFEKMKLKELERIGKKGEMEVGVYFEKNLLSSLSFNYTSGPWGDNYWIMFPNPEKLNWTDVAKALKTGFAYLSECNKTGNRELGMLGD